MKIPKGKRERRVAITSACAEVLGRLYEAEVVHRGRAAEGYVFTGRDGVGPIGDDSPLEAMQKLQQRAGLVVQRDGKLRPLVTFHELRHTAATAMLTGGKAAAVVARQLGHASSQVTTGVYEAPALGRASWTTPSTSLRAQTLPSTSPSLPRPRRPRAQTLLD